MNSQVNTNTFQDRKTLRWNSQVKEMKWNSFRWTLKLIFYYFKIGRLSGETLRWKNEVKFFQVNSQVNILLFQDRKTLRWNSQVNEMKCISLRWTLKINTLLFQDRKTLRWNSQVKEMIRNSLRWNPRDEKYRMNIVGNENVKATVLKLLFSPGMRNRCSACKNGFWVKPLWQPLLPCKILSK